MTANQPTCWVERNLWHSLAAALVLLVLPGCFAQNIAEGQYVESESSGRVQQFEDRDHTLESMRMMRLSIVAFDEDAAGIIEFFRVGSFESFESRLRADNTSVRSANYFCTRLERALSRDETLVLEFVDSENRRWQVTGQITQDGDIVESRFERVAADGTVLEIGNDEPLATEALWPEDREYYAEDGTTERQLVIERVASEVTDDDLACVEYQLRDELILELPESLPLEDRRLRASLIVTDPRLAPEISNPLRGVNYEEVLSAPLEPVLDVDAGERRLLVRVPPEQLSDLSAGIAVATLIVYEDRPDEDGELDGHWNNIRASGVHEPVWAYTLGQSVVYNRDPDPLTAGARNAMGNRIDDPLFDGASERQTGWTLHAFTADALDLPNGEQVLLVRQFGGPEPVATLESFSQNAGCRWCYPEPAPSSELPAGVQPPDCDACPAILPLLYY